MDKNNLIKLNHTITYNDPQLHVKFKITDEKEKQDLQDIIYKYDLISIFGLNDFIEEKIIEKIETLYKLIIQNEELQSICSNAVNENQEFEKFMILFSYDHLHLFYPCVCEFLDKGIISNEKIITLKNNVSKI
jgi:hypothetical protein